MYEHRTLKAVAASLAAVALSAVLAPAAFAATAPTPETSSETNAFAGNEASTTLGIKANTTNIKAVVPMKVSVVALANGGDITPPDNYRIENQSRFGIKVSKIAVSGINSKWNLVASGVSANTAPVAAGKSDLYLTVKGVALGSAAVTSGLEAFTAEAVDASGNAGVLELPLAGSTSMLVDAADTANALTVTYTIEAQ